MACVHLPNTGELHVSSLNFLYTITDNHEYPGDQTVQSCVPIIEKKYRYFISI